MAEVEVRFHVSRSLSVSGSILFDVQEDVNYDTLVPFPDALE